MSVQIIGLRLAILNIQEVMIRACSLRPIRSSISNSFIERVWLNISLATARWRIPREAWRQAWRKSTPPQKPEVRRNILGNIGGMMAAGIAQGRYELMDFPHVLLGYKKSITPVARGTPQRLKANPPMRA